MPAQIVTMDDLKEFKQELLETLKKMLEEKPAPIEKTDKKWLKSNEVQKLLGISAATLQNFRIKGALSFSKFGGTLYYDYDEIQKILEFNRMNNIQM